MNKRVFVLGLDALEPSLAFEKFEAGMPNLTRLRKRSVWGISESVIPPLSCTAWVSFAKGKNPGQSAIQGFVSRKDFAYDKFFVANSTVIERERVWDVLKENGKKCIVINVPVTYPPYDVNGVMVSGFLTPSEEKQFTFPAEIKEEINEIAGPYTIDIKDFKRKPKDVVFRELIEMEEKRFKVAKRFIREKEWDFFIFVTTGTDRVHHVFWADMDETHPEHEKGSEFANAIKNYYKFIDEKIGEIAELLEENDVLIIMSDHGVRALHGFFNLNDWFERNGYLRLFENPKEPVRFEEAKIDWSNTKAFCTGNYVARVFINLKGREPQGTVEEAEYDPLRNEIRKRLLSLKDDMGNKMRNIVFRREELYKGKHVDKQPDLIVLFDDMRFGVNQMIGHKTLFSYTAEKGRNTANHYRFGVFVMHNSGQRPRKVENIKLIDIMPTILKLLGVKIPKDVEGKPIV